MSNDSTAARALAFIETAIAAKKTVYISTMTNCVAVSPRTVASWKKSGNVLFKLSPKGDLLMASGKRFDCIATPSVLLVALKAS